MGCLATALFQRREAIRTGGWSSRTTDQNQLPCRGTGGGVGTAGTEGGAFGFAGREPSFRSGGRGGGGVGFLGFSLIVFSPEWIS